MPPSQNPSCVSDSKRGCVGEFGYISVMGRHFTGTRTNNSNDHLTIKEAWLDMDTVDTDVINLNLSKQTYFKSSCRCYLQKSNKILPLNST